MMRLTGSPFSHPFVTPPALASSSAAATKPGYLLGYLVFLLVNAALYMRPTEIFPEYLYEKTYLVLILTCLALSLFAVTKQLSLQSLVEQPITACILRLLVAVVMSQVGRFAVDEAID